jgi:hypothetical protein
VKFSRLAALVTAAAALALPAAAQATVSPFSATLSGGFSEFSQTGIADGTLATTTGGYGGGSAAVASYAGDGSNGYARAIENVAWSPTEDVWYGGAYYLPTGYLESLKGGNDILRWDNWGTYGEAGDYGAVENWSDGMTRLILGKYTNDPGIVLGQPFKLPEGRWFWLEVHQTFSTGAGALSQVFVDGQLVDSSTQPNNFGRGADRVRWGIVCIGAGQQNVPLQLEFSRSTISTAEVGPLAGTTPPPSQQPNPPSQQPTGGSGSSTSNPPSTPHTPVVSHPHRPHKAVVHRAHVAKVRRHLSKTRKLRRRS